MVILAFIMLLMAECECVTFMRMTMRLLLPRKRKARLHLHHTQLSFTSLHSSMAYCWMKSVCNCWSFLFKCTEPASYLEIKKPCAWACFLGSSEESQVVIVKPFPGTATGRSPDPKLAAAYRDAALENMRKRCLGWCSMMKNCWDLPFVHFTSEKKIHQISSPKTSIYSCCDELLRGGTWPFMSGALRRVIDRYGQHSSHSKP